jgi:hypothetical protein
LSRLELEAAFPNLAADGYEISSPESRSYNCIAWAAGDMSRKWDCTGIPLVGYYWPQKALVGEGIEALVSAFETQGYRMSESTALEPGLEKVALYADEQSMWTHAARQLPDGRWSSKLGDAEDIAHSTPHGVAGSIYGQVRHVLQRSRATG